MGLHRRDGRQPDSHRSSPKSQQNWGEDFLIDGFRRIGVLLAIVSRLAFRMRTLTGRQSQIHSINGVVQRRGCRRGSPHYWLYTLFSDELAEAVCLVSEPKFFQWYLGFLHYPVLRARRCGHPLRHGRRHGLRTTFVSAASSSTTGSNRRDGWTFSAYVYEAHPHAEVRAGPGLTRIPLSLLPLLAAVAVLLLYAEGTSSWAVGRVFPTATVYIFIVDSAKATGSTVGPIKPRSTCGKPAVPRGGQSFLKGASRM